MIESYARSAANLAGDAEVRLSYSPDEEDLTVGAARATAALAYANAALA